MLIDIYGGQNQKYVNRKIIELASWIHDDNFNRTIKDNKLIRWTRDFIRWITVGRMYRVYGVVLAPFLPGDSYTNGAVTVVRGIEAQGLLGGFMQAARWLKP